MKVLYTYTVLIFFAFIQSNGLSAQSWEEQAVGLLPNDYGVIATSIVDENTVWAVAFNQNIGVSIPLSHITKVLRTIDGGASWEVFDVEEAMGRVSFDIQAHDANTAFITTQDYNNGSGRGVFKTEDGGVTWEEKFHHVSAGVWIRFFNDQDGVIINRQHIATTQDGGESWQFALPNNIPAFLSGEYTGLSSGSNSCQVVGDHIWFGTSKGRVFRSKNKGHNWEVFNTTLGTDALILSITFKDTLNGLALDASSLSSFNRTNDGGETWTIVEASPDLDISNIAFIPGTEGGLIGATDVYSPIISRISAYSNDFGATWEVLDLGTPYSGIDFIDANTGWIGRGRIYSTNQPAMLKWVDDVFVATRGIQAEIDCQVFPNPFTSTLNIKSVGESVSSYRLFGNQGELIRQGTVENNRSILNFENLNMGIYHLELNSDDGRRTAKKIIKAN